MNFNIVLIGMPGSGKSTVGVVLAKKLGFDFLDTDILLSKKEGFPLSDLIVKHGYEDFLLRENELAKRVKDKQIITIPAGHCVSKVKNESRIQYAADEFPDLFSLDYDKIVIEMELFSGSYDTRQPMYELSCYLPDESV